MSIFTKRPWILVFSKKESGTDRKKSDTEILIKLEVQLQKDGSYKHKIWAEKFVNGEHFTDVTLDFAKERYKEEEDFIKVINEFNL